jgi:uncharacterized integral membrane protein
VERTANNIGTEKVYILPLVPSAVGVFRHKLHGSMKLLDLPDTCRLILMQKAVILNICKYSQEVFDRRVYKHCWGSKTRILLRSSPAGVKLLWKVIEVGIIIIIIIIIIGVKTAGCETDLSFHLA